METDSISPRSVGDQVKIAMNKGWLQRLGYRLPYPSQWRRISTAPYNRELELRTSDNGETVTLDFPCLRTREEAWINVDLGTEIKVQPVEWRIWQGEKSPKPHHSKIRLALTPRSQARQAAGYRQQRFGAIMPNTHRCFVMINFALKQLSLSTMRSRTHSRAQNIFVQRWNILSPMKRLCSCNQVSMRLSSKP